MSNLHNNPHLELPPVTQQPVAQQPIASVYPQLPSQDELPSYSPYPQYTQQPPYAQNTKQQYNQQQQYVQQQQYAQQQQYVQQHSSQQYHQTPPQQYQQQQNYCHHPPPPTTTQPGFYGTMAPPNISSPGPAQPQNSQQAVNSVLSIHELKTSSELVQCPHCRQFVHTVLDYDAGLCTGLSIAGLFMVGCNNGLCLLPWLFPWTKDVTHQCPSCKENIATFTRLERDTRVLSATT